ncbi:MAG: monofunctional biosynthetic peptidoglycan transglycosylase [Bauldia sp.]
MARKAAAVKIAWRRAGGYATGVSDDPPSDRPKRRGLWRLVRRVVVVLILIPVVLVPVYRFVWPVSTLMAFDFVARGGDVQRTWVPFDKISPALVASVIMSEDGKFCSHRGVDWDELSKVLDREDDRPRGASTIAMQAAKNLFLWNSRSYLRKAVEMPIALYADFVWGKQREMEIYLNIVEWGPGIFGAEAAARHYFKRGADQLTAGQAALLTAALPNPWVRDPSRPSAALQALARTIAERARMAGAYIDCLYPRPPL